MPSERPKAISATERVVWTQPQIEQTVAAARDPWRTLLVIAAVTGARVGEILGLTWEGVDLADLDGASLTFRKQLDREGNYVQTNAEGSARRLPIPRDLGAILVRHKLAGRATADGAPGFAASTGRPLQHRNVSRAMRAAMKAARAPDGSRTFPRLHERDAAGKPVKIARGELPSMHSFRHAYASEWLAEGESVDEVAFLLGHANANVTRAVYTHESGRSARGAAPLPDGRGVRKCDGSGVGFDEARRFERRGPEPTRTAALALSPQRASRAVSLWVPRRRPRGCSHQAQRSTL